MLENYIRQLYANSEAYHLIPSCKRIVQRTADGSYTKKPSYYTRGQLELTKPELLKDLETFFVKSSSGGEYSLINADSVYSKRLPLELILELPNLDSFAIHTSNEKLINIDIDDEELANKILDYLKEPDFESIADYVCKTRKGYQLFFLADDVSKTLVKRKFDIFNYKSKVESTAISFSHEANNPIDGFEYYKILKNEPLRRVVPIKLAQLLLGEPIKTVHTGPIFGEEEKIKPVSSYKTHIPIGPLIDELLSVSDIEKFENLHDLDEKILFIKSINRDLATRITSVLSENNLQPWLINANPAFLELLTNGQGLRNEVLTRLIGRMRNDDSVSLEKAVEFLGIFCPLIGHKARLQSDGHFRDPEHQVESLLKRGDSVWRTKKPEIALTNFEKRQNRIFSRDGIDEALQECGVTVWRDALNSKNYYIFKYSQEFDKSYIQPDKQFIKGLHSYDSLNDFIAVCSSKTDLFKEVGGVTFYRGSRKGEPNDTIEIPVRYMIFEPGLPRFFSKGCSEYFNYWTASEYLKGFNELEPHYELPPATKQLLDLVFKYENERDVFLSKLSYHLRTMKYCAQLQVVTGPAGTGKSMLLNFLLPKIYQNNCTTVSSDFFINSHFNSRLSNTVYVHFDDIKFNHKNASASSLADWLKNNVDAGKDKVYIQAKGKDAYLAKRYNFMTMATNDAEPFERFDESIRRRVDIYTGGTVPLVESVGAENIDNFIQSLTDEIPQFLQYLKSLSISEGEYFKPFMSENKLSLTRNAESEDLEEVLRVAIQSGRTDSIVKHLEYLLDLNTPEDEQARQLILYSIAYYKFAYQGRLVTLWPSLLTRIYTTIYGSDARRNMWIIKRALSNALLSSASQVREKMSTEPRLPNGLKSQLRKVLLFKSDDVFEREIRHDWHLEASNTENLLKGE